MQKIKGDNIMKKKFRVTWEERYCAIIEADNIEEARNLAHDLDSTLENYQECTSQEIEEWEEGQYNANTIRLLDNMPDNEINSRG